MDNQFETKAGFDAVNKYEKMRFHEETTSFPIDIKHYQLLPFVKAMDEVLCENDHKGGWLDCDIKYLQARLVGELGEYFELVSRGSAITHPSDRYRKELIDIANFAMMLWDRS